MTFSSSFYFLLFSLLPLPSLSERTPHLANRIDYNSIPPSKRWSDWKPPGPQDHRGPCPALNILANHGYINRNGTNLKPKDVGIAMKEHLGMPIPNTERAAWAAVFALGNTTTGEFSLGNYGITNPYFGMGLSSHGIEHDASLLREDAYVGDNRNPSVDLFAEFMAVRREMGKDAVDIEVMTRFMRKRHEDSMARNPTYSANLANRLNQFMEAASILTVFGPNLSLAVSEENLRSAMLFERLPEDFQRLELSNDIEEFVDLFIPLVIEMYNMEPLEVKGAAPFPQTASEFACAQRASFREFVHVKDLGHEVLKRTQLPKCIAEDS